MIANVKIQQPGSACVEFEGLCRFCGRHRRFFSIVPAQFQEAIAKTDLNWSECTECSLLRKTAFKDELPTCDTARKSSDFTHFRRRLTSGKEDHMLVLSRQSDETIIIGDNIRVTIVEVRGDKVRIGIDAPRDVTVHRQEIYDAIRREAEPGAKTV